VTVPFTAVFAAALFLFPGPCPFQRGGEKELEGFLAVTPREQALNFLFPPFFAFFSQSGDLLTRRFDELISHFSLLSASGQSSPGFLAEQVDQLSFSLSSP